MNAPPGPAKRFVVDVPTRCAHCERQLDRGAFMYRTARGVYCSPTCKMWHEGIRGPEQRRDAHRQSR